MSQWALLYVNFKHAFELPRGHYQNDGTLIPPHTFPYSLLHFHLCHVVCLVITIETTATMIIIMFCIVILVGLGKWTP